MLRWQIEIYFREIKGDLGINDFSGQSFEAFERFVDVCLLAFLFLEWNRNRLIKMESSRKEKGKLFRIRTHGMKIILHTEAMLEAKEIFRRKLVA